MENFNIKKYLTESNWSGLLKEEITDIQDIIVKAGINLNDGILGGVGSGGAGYYDSISDKISGFRLDKFDENEFNNWYDNFSKEDFAETRKEKEFSEENDDGIDYNMIGQINPGIYVVGDMGYAQIHDNGDIQLFSPPYLGDDDGNMLPIFTMNASGNAIPAMDREEVITKLQQGFSIL